MATNCCYVQNFSPIKGQDGLSAAEQFKMIYSKKYYELFTDRVLEDKVMEILKSDQWKSDDIIDVLHWKTGASTYSYEKRTVKTRWGEIEAKDLIDKIEGVKKVSDKPEETLKVLMEPKGIGPVYALTLLFFLSKGKYPIYDKYAHMALDAYQKGKEPGEGIVYQELPTNPQKIMKKLDEYKERIKHIFGDNALEDRDVDRALWAYGHLFVKTKKKRD